MTLYINRDKSNSTLHFNGDTLPSNNNEYSIVIEKGTENVTLKDFRISGGKGIRVHGNNHTIELGKIKTKGVGIFIEEYSHNNIIKKCDIQSNGTGIYLEQASHHNLIQYNNIHDCGYWDEISIFPYIFPKLSWAKREGIAIDASTDNIIEYNTLKDNALAGITLYKNCGEHSTFLRREGANRNTIYKNIISGSKIDIWENAREWRDMITWDCLCEGEWVNISDVPKQPYQQWFNWACLTTPFSKKTAKFRFPIRTKIWKVKDECLDNVIVRAVW